MVDRKKLRSQSQQQNLKTYIDNQNNIQSAEINRLGERNLNTGKDAVIYPNNSNVIAGQRMFSASLPLGAPMQTTQPYGNAMVALNQRSCFEDDDIFENEPVLTGEFKVLFSIFENGVTTFYIGGDRTVPLRILELPVESVAGYITNTGKGKNDWICGFKYTDLNGNSIIKSIGKNSHTWEISDPLTVQCTYRGWGYWTNDFVQIFPYVVNTEEENTRNRLDYYFNYETGDYIEVSNSLAPLDYNYYSTISDYETFNRIETYGFNDLVLTSVGQDIYNLTRSQVNSFDPNNYSDEYEYYYYYYPYKGTLNVSTNRDKNISTITTNIDIFKNELNVYNGELKLTTTETTSLYLLQEQEYQLPFGYIQWGAYQTKTETQNSNDNEKTTGFTPILPSFQYPINIDKSFTYNTTSNVNYYENYLEDKPGEFYSDIFTLDITNNQSLNFTTLKQVYIPNTGTPTSFLARDNNSSTYIYPDTYTSQQDSGIYLLNYTTNKLINANELFALTVRKTNLIKNIFYESPIEKITDDPILGSVIEAPKYINKNITLEGNKYTINTDGVVSKTTFKAKI